MLDSTRNQNWSPCSIVCYWYYLRSQKNRHTCFLRQRLFALEAPAFPLSNCAMQEGMLQLAKDFCHNFHQGYHRCELVTLLQEGASQPLL